MKVAVVSKSDRNGGGASRVAEELATWLNEAGHPTDHYITFSFKSPLPFQKSLYGAGRQYKFCKKIHEKTYRYGFPELLPTEYLANLSLALNEYDVVHFHDLYTAISPFTLALTALHKPTFFTVHDCSAFTGGCLYPMDCQHYKTHCHSCPQLPLNNETNQPIPDRTRTIQTIKRWVSHRFPLQYIFPSSWMCDQAAQVLSYKLSPVVIPNGLDLKPFSNSTKQAAKFSYQLPTDRPVIAISAHCLDDPRKGLKYAIAALQSVRDLSPVVVTIGFINDELRQALQGLETREMGYISDYNTLANVYLATDVVLFCTLADNLPLTVLEAMAASTPVVGFATGGVPEMIQSGRNGILVEPTDQASLNTALRKLLRSSEFIAMGMQARQDVEANFSKGAFIERHLQMYQSSISSNSQSRKS